MEAIGDGDPDAVPLPDGVRVECACCYQTQPFFAVLLGARTP